MVWVTEVGRGGGDPREGEPFEGPGGDLFAECAESHV